MNRPNKRLKTNNSFSYHKMIEADILPLPTNKVSSNRKYDAAVLPKRKFDDRDFVSPCEKPKTISINITSSSHQPENLSSLGSNSFYLADTDSELDTVKCYDQSEYNLNNEVTPSRNSTATVDIKYNYECFQLYSDKLFQNITSTSESERLALTYESCLPLASKFFKNLQPIKTKPHTKLHKEYQHEYDPLLDRLPNYKELTELEISLLQRLSCGCKSLTWDEYEKMCLKIGQSETMNISNSETDINQIEIEKSLIQHDASDGCKREIIIKDCKIHRHSHDSAKPLVHFIDYRPSASSVDYIEVEKDDSDPLFTNNKHPDMVDQNNSVLYVSLEGNDVQRSSNDSTTDNEEIKELDVPERRNEVLAFNKDEIDNLKTRLKNFRLNSVSPSLLPSEEEVKLLESTPSSKNSEQLQGKTQPEETFILSGVDFVALENKTCSSDKDVSLSGDILSDAISKELNCDDGETFAVCTVFNGSERSFTDNDNLSKSNDQSLASKNSSVLIHSFRSQINSPVTTTTTTSAPLIPVTASNTHSFKSNTSSKSTAVLQTHFETDVDHANPPCVIVSASTPSSDKNTSSNVNCSIIGKVLSNDELLTILAKEAVSNSNDMTTILQEPISNLQNLCNKDDAIEIIECDSSEPAPTRSTEDSAEKLITELIENTAELTDELFLLHCTEEMLSEDSFNPHLS